MDLSYSEEQRQLLDSALRYVGERYDVARRREIVASTAGFSREVWQDFARFGWLALPLPEAHGGLGGDAVDVSLLVQAFGRAGVVEPYVSTVLLAGGLIAAVGTPAQQAAWLPAIAEGRSLWAFAHAAAARHSTAIGPTIATRTVHGWALDGAKRVVEDAPLADAYIVSARLDGGATALLRVDRGTPGVDLKETALIDGRRAADLRFSQVALPADALLGSGEDASDAIEAVLDRARAALAAESLGCMRALLETTLAYTRTRQQFGQPLSANQVLRHRMVDMAVHCEEAESMALLAAMKAAAPSAERSLAVSAAMDKIGRAARFVGEQAVQLHGAMGVTEEVAVGIWLKRLIAIEVSLGTPSFHRDRHARLRGLTQELVKTKRKSSAAAVSPTPLPVAAPA